jgi:hypothetical protein
VTEPTAAISPSEGIELDADPYGIAHVFEYRYAASRLLTAQVDSQRMLARPICYLARHALELALKHALAAADAEYHHLDLGHRPFETTWTSHDLRALLENLDHLLVATGNSEVPTRARDVILRLHALDPDGQRFRYAKARVKGGEPVISLAKGTRLNLNDLVNDMDEAVSALFDIDPAGPRHTRERNEEIEALTATQRLPVHPVEKGFGARRSTEGYVLLPTSAAPGLKPGELVRLLSPGEFELAWEILKVEGSDYVLNSFQDSFRLPAARIAKAIEQGQCPVCSSRRLEPIGPVQEETVIFEAGVVHHGESPPLHRPDRQCRSCRHRFESVAVRADAETPSELTGVESSLDG